MIPPPTDAPELDIVSVTGRTAPRKPAPVVKPKSIKLGGLRGFAPPPPTPEEKAKAKAETPRKREKFKNDPKMVEAARELRDRYLEQVNASMLLPPGACGKYDVSRQLEAAPSVVKDAAMKIEQLPNVRLLDAA